MRQQSPLATRAQMALACILLLGALTCTAAVFPAPPASADDGRAAAAGPDSPCQAECVFDHWVDSDWYCIYEVCSRQFPYCRSFAQRAYVEKCIDLDCNVTYHNKIERICPTDRCLSGWPCL